MYLGVIEMRDKYCKISFIFSKFGIQIGKMNIVSDLREVKRKTTGEDCTVYSGELRKEFGSQFFAILYSKIIIKFNTDVWVFFSVYTAIFFGKRS